MQTIKAFGRTFALAPFPGAPVDTVYIGGNVPHTATGPDLVTFHNLAASNLGRPAVKRFSDRATAEKRTWTILQDFDRAEAGDLAASTGKAPRADMEMKSRPPAAQLGEGDKKQITDEAAARTPAASEQLLEAAAAAGAKTQAQAALRNNPPASDNPAKDAEMPALRRAVKVTELAPKKTVYARKAGSKQAVLVDLLSRPEGATFGELYDGLAATGKPWRGVTIRSGLAWDINHIAGYGVTSELFNGDAFAQQGRTYEARRLGVGTEGYDPELRLAVYRLTYPAGMTAPHPHIAKKAAKA